LRKLVAGKILPKELQARLTGRTASYKQTRIRILKRARGNDLWLTEPLTKGAANPGGRADGNRKQRGSRALTF
jgi:hypothetical protein